MWLVQQYTIWSKTKIYVLCFEILDWNERNRERHLWTIFDSILENSALVRLCWRKWGSGCLSQPIPVVWTHYVYHSLRSLVQMIATRFLLLARTTQSSTSLNTPIFCANVDTPTLNFIDTQAKILYNIIIEFWGSLIQIRGILKMGHRSIMWV